VAAAPILKVYLDGRYIAACKHGETAAMICAGYGDGTEVRYGHRHVVWNEGHEAQGAAESYDYTSDTIERRIRVLYLTHKTFS